MTIYSDPGAIGAVVEHVTRIEAGWGNAVRLRLLHHFLDSNARDSAFPTPSEGQACYLNATDEFLIANGLRWNPPWNLPWGWVAGNAPPVADQAAITTIADITGASVSWTAVANRKYKVTVKVEASNTVAAAGALITVADSGNTIKKQARANFPTATTSDTIAFSYVELGLGSGNAQRKLRATASGGGIVTINNAGGGFAAEILVEDIGPNGVPA